MTYSQGDGRLYPDTSKVGDCSSTIYAAYRDAANYRFTLSTGNPEIWGGARIETAEVGENLTYSRALPGDIVGFASRSNDNNIVHVALYMGEDEGLWEMNEWSTGANAGKKGTQPVDYTVNGTNIYDYRTDCKRFIVRYLMREN